MTDPSRQSFLPIPPPRPRAWCGAGLLALLLLLAVPAANAAQASIAIDGSTALVIIDIQDFYFPGGALPLVEPEAASHNAARLLALFRERGFPIVHVGHNARSGSAFHPDVTPCEGEAVFHKDEVNAFQGTGLLEHLRSKGIRRLVLCGMQTHMCLEAATRAAHDLGFECVVVADACATRDLSYGGRAIASADVHAGTLAALDGVYARVVSADDLLATE